MLASLPEYLTVFNNMVFRTLVLLLFHGLLQTTQLAGICLPNRGQRGKMAGSLESGFSLCTHSNGLNEGQQQQPACIQFFSSMSQGWTIIVY